MDKSLAELAVLYADVCDSTRLYEEFGDAIARADIAECIEVLSSAVTSLDGEVIKTIGDEIMCAFVDPVRAALASTEMQAALRKASEESRFKMGTLRIKVGWHYGAVGWRQGELIGEAPITAQQIIKRAQADEILTSHRAVEILPAGMFPSMHFIVRIPAEAWEGDLEVHKLPWEQTGQETLISSASMKKVEVPTQAVLLLDYKGTKFRVNGVNTFCRIGRAKDMDLRVLGNFTSRQHAEIGYRNGRFPLRDVSVNGTVIVDQEGNVKRLHREEGILTGSGTIGFGGLPQEDPDGVVLFKCE